VLDPGLAPANPLDVWGTGRDAEAQLTGSLAALAADPAVAALALAVDLVPEFDGGPYVRVRRPERFFDGRTTSRHPGQPARGPDHTAPSSGGRSSR
jgi:hypothetical protein